MMDIENIGQAVRERRNAVGLTQDRLSNITSLPVAAIEQLEADTIDSIPFAHVLAILWVLSLSYETLDLSARSKKRGLWMAAMSSSVSYRVTMSGEELSRALATAEAPPEIHSNLLYFLDEVSFAVIVMAVEETAQQECLEPAKVWDNLATLALQLGSVRKEIWT